MKTIFRMAGGIFILAVLLLTIGCGSSDKLLNYNFKQGTGELQLRFLENAPPEKIYPRSNFKIIVEADNQAAYDVTDGVVTLVGLDRKYFSLLSDEQSLENLPGRSLSSPNGDKAFLEFEGLAGELFQNAEQYVGNFFVKAKYNSKVDFTDTVCLNPNLYAVYDSGCAVQERKTYGGQGAPLAITQLEEISSPGGGASVEFRLTLQNRGRGKVNFINLQSAFLGAEPMNCEFQNTGSNKHSIQVTERNPSPVLICKAFLREQKSYMTTLNAEFSYDYELKEQRKLTLVR